MTYNNDDSYKDKDGYRDKVSEFKEGAVVVEVYEKKDTRSDRVFFDVKHMREFVSNGERKRGPFIQQRDLRDNIIALVRAQKFISERHREIRRGSSHSDPYSDEEID